MKWALIQVHRYLAAHSMESHLVNVVHDDMMLDCVLAEISQLVEVVPELMTHEEVNSLVPIRPEPEISWTTWAGKEPL
jgi:DNA polymerase I-like protein with 3'-5' exonuclease and polymerase domains